jgi:hypothetical protein
MYGSETEQPLGDGDSVAAPDAFADVSGVLLAHLVAPVLADLPAVPDGELLDSVLAFRRMESWTVAHRARLSAELLQRARADIAADEAELAATMPSSASRGGARRVAASFSHEFEDERMAHSMVEVELSLAQGHHWLGGRARRLARRGADRAPGAVPRLSVRAARPSPHGADPA